MPDFADDTSSELERKAKALKFMALFETVTYVLLFYFWVIAPNDALKAIVGFEVPIDAIRGTRKFNQHKDDADTAATLAGLRAAGMDAVAEAVEEVRP